MVRVNFFQRWPFLAAPTPQAADDAEGELESNQDDPQWRWADQVLNRHFSLATRIQEAFDERGLHGNERCIALCKEMIALAPDALNAFRVQYRKEIRRAELNTSFALRIPRHTGYQRLITIFEEEGRFAEAITLCKQAEKLGWSGNWAYFVRRLESGRKASVA